MRWLVLVLAACYSPHPLSGAPCAAGNTCPEGLACVATPQGAVCAPPGTVFPDAPPMHDAPDVDAPADARPIDAPRPPSPTLVQEMTNQAQTAATLDATFAATPTAGNLLVMVGAANGGALDSVAGAATWTVATGNFDNSNIEIWYGYADGSGSTVTIARAANINNMWLQISEWSNMATTAPLDGAASAGGVASTAGAPAITTTHPHDLLIFGVASGTPATLGAPTPGSWIAMTTVQTLDNTQSEWHREVNTANTFTPTVSDTGGGWDAAIAAFKAAN